MAAACRITAGNARTEEERQLAQVEWLIRRTALQLAHAGVGEFADLYQSGTLGALDAIRRFDPTRGLALVTFAGPRIRGAMLDDCRNGGLMTRKSYERLQAAVGPRNPLEEYVAERYDAGVTLDEIAVEVQATAEDVREIIGRLAGLNTGARYIASLDALLPVSGRPVDLPAPGDAYADSDDAAELACLWTWIGQLAPRDRHACERYFRDGATQAEIGRELGVTESRVCQMLGRATLRLRARLVDAAA